MCRRDRQGLGVRKMHLILGRPVDGADADVEDGQHRLAGSLLITWARQPAQPMSVTPGRCLSAPIELTPKALRHRYCDLIRIVDRGRSGTPGLGARVRPDARPSSADQEAVLSLRDAMIGC